MKKTRLDVLLLEKGLAASREKARTMIMEGIVYVNGGKEDKPGMQFAEDADIEVRGKTLPYVSRGGLKLEKALKIFPVRTQGVTAIDIGASTGGFTDCLLMNGASRVYAIDVGYGQLSWKLRSDPRVIVMEKTNIRYVKPQDIPEKADLAVTDVSFISLTKVLPAASELLHENGEMICLIKPQFEAGREKVGKKGVVRDPAVHREVIESILSFAGTVPLYPQGLGFSPIRGPEGNIEYLLYLSKQPPAGFSGGTDEIRTLVAEAHQSFGGSTEPEGEN